MHALERLRPPPSCRGDVAGERRGVAQGSVRNPEVVPRREIDLQLRALLVLFSGTSQAVVCS